MPEQGGAAGIVKKAMAALTPYYKKYVEEWHVCWPLMQIHDDLLWEIEEDAVDVLLPTIMEVMAKAVTLDVPVLVDAKVGTHWGSLKD